MARKLQNQQHLTERLTEPFRAISEIDESMLSRTMKPMIEKIHNHHSQLMTIADEEGKLDAQGIRLKYLIRVLIRNVTNLRKRAVDAESELRQARTEISLMRNMVANLKIANRAPKKDRATTVKGSRTLSDTSELEATVMVDVPNELLDLYATETSEPTIPSDQCQGSVPRSASQSRGPSMSRNSRQVEYSRSAKS